MSQNKTKEEFQFKTQVENKNFEENMKQSFEFWHRNYVDAPLNYLLVWRKALESNSKIIKKVEELWKEDTEQIAKIQMQQFFEMWSYAIRKSDFEMAKKSMQDWKDLWKNTTDKEFKLYGEILQIIGNSWEDMQNKNLE